jgi:hypothetical protein
MKESLKRREEVSGIQEIIMKHCLTIVGVDYALTQHLCRAMRTLGLVSHGARRQRQSDS